MKRFCTAKEIGSALDRATPMEIEIRKNEYYCPYCSKGLSDRDGDDFCSNCGQRLWWGEDE